MRMLRHLLKARLLPREPLQERNPLTPLVAGGWVRAGFLSVAISGIGLFTFARTVMNGPVAVITLFHLVAGGAGTIWIMALWIRNRYHVCGRLDLLLWTSVALAGATGWIMLIMALLGQSTGAVPLLFYGHVASGVAGAASAAWRWWKPNTGRRAAVGVLTIGTLLAMAAMGARCYDAADYYRRITSTNSRQAHDPLFPSGAHVVAAGEWRRAVPAAGCTRSGCHDTVRQSWHAASHALSSSTPLYRATEDYAFGRGGDAVVRWCRGCHAPLRTVVPSEKSVGCLTCHSMCRVPDAMGNGSAWYGPPAAYPFAYCERGPGRWLHDFLLRVRPEPHRATLRGPNPQNGGAPMCLPCHRLGVNVPQNRYRYLHYDDTWMDWQNSPFSGWTVHTFEAGQSRHSCTDCHFAGGTSRAGDLNAPSGAGRAGLPAEDGSERGKILRLKRCLRVEIFALKRAGARSLALAAPAGSVPATVAPGEEVVADVLVESRGVGHAFPTGEPDLCEMWLDFRVLTEGGRVIFQSGIGPNPGMLARDAHTYGLVGLDRQGERLHGGNVFNMVAVAYQRVRGTGQADTPRYRCLLPDVGDVARYRFRIPVHVAGHLVFSARLWYRPVNRVLASMVHLRVRPSARGSGGDALSAVVVAEDRVTVHVQRGADTAIIGAAPRRWYAYGAALLLEKDTASARAAFQIARDQAPSWPEAWIGLGRAYLEEGDLLAARGHMQKALELQPGNPRARAWLGRVCRLMGRYDEALRLLRPLARDYPMDRLTWLDIGLCLLQQDRLAPAAEAFRRMLDADPNDAVAHFNLMQCYRRLLRISDARGEEVVYRILQESAPPATILLEYARTHPAEYRESQPVHEHILVPAGAPGRR